MGLTPDPPPDDGDASDVGRPPSGSRSTRGFPPLTKPVPVFALSGIKQLFIRN